MEWYLVNYSVYLESWDSSLSGEGEAVGGSLGGRDGRDGRDNRRKDASE